MDLQGGFTARECFQSVSSKGHTVRALEDARRNQATYSSLPREEATSAFAARYNGGLTSLSRPSTFFFPDRIVQKYSL